MADTVLLKKLYADESDSQLIEKVLNKDNGLTAEALTIAKAELVKRNIDLSELEIANEKKIALKKNYERFLSDKTEAQLNVWKDFIISEKLKHSTNKEIVKAFEEQGISPDISRLLIEDSKENCKEIIDSIWGDLFYGGIFTLVGIAITIGLYRLSEGRTLFIAYGAIFLALLKFFRGLMKLTVYSSLKKIIKDFST